METVITDNTPPNSALSGAEQRKWSQMAREARAAGRLDPYESWYDTDHRLITIAALQHEDDTFTCVALAGDLDSPDLQVLGHYWDETDAIDASPPPVMPGALRPSTPHVPTPEISLGHLIHDVRQARRACDVGEAIDLVVGRDGPTGGQLVQLEEFVTLCAEFAQALDTRHAQRVAGRLGALAHQISALTAELKDAGEDLASTVAVLPPHHTPAPHRLGPGQRPLTTTLPATAPPATVRAHHH
ncbi:MULTISPECIES: hypothetical protein [Streptomyces]|uniref:Uncharacterized protein n=1 Tax=Streptomyces tsukubensis (strain DSM 42081 / NBRC 108919 / NRRL 18488 / 9993) TaxID=1114943 RepID=I2N7X7_STRT9|nr:MULTISPECIES: hypothetical protein [Streptomyces]AZK97039.1 hypothetical protein B7R87_26590 [Streptomyces tsukubensis]EIF93124.1 hypothetical protein [Streptomyces tsukubensis NRRL18488]MYS66521.1 hypothetical protein [Streptomyces sp. SID5473]QKM66987.1 hypothetical protein STSU_007190 [Streptomyces tsukubensis NRRL18488]TAI41536.1 hypothetical protein EWI31_27260 [Streptomyces tsukubensis]